MSNFVGQPVIPSIWSLLLSSVGDRWILGLCRRYHGIPVLFLALGLVLLARLPLVGVRPSRELGGLPLPGAVPG